MNAFFLQMLTQTIKKITDGKPPGNFQNNDYRPDPTGGRADRIRGASENGSVKNGLPRPGAGAANSPAHNASLQVAAGSSSGATPQRPSIRGQSVIALYSYQGSEFGDMSFQKGDQMEIIDDS